MIPSAVRIVAIAALAWCLSMVGWMQFSTAHNGEPPQPLGPAGAGIQRYITQIK